MPLKIASSCCCSSLLFARAAQALEGEGVLRLRLQWGEDLRRLALKRVIIVFTWSYPMRDVPAPRRGRRAEYESTGGIVALMVHGSSSTFAQ